MTDDRSAQQLPERVLDVRDLPAPEPFEAILEALPTLGEGDELLARTPRLPRLLIQRLQERGLELRFWEEPDGTGAVWIRRPA